MNELMRCRLYYLHKPPEGLPNAYSLDRGGYIVYDIGVQL